MYIGDIGLELSVFPFVVSFLFVSLSDFGTRIILAL
jgi:hypothetical protein